MRQNSFHNGGQGGDGNGKSKRCDASVTYFADDGTTMRNEFVVLLIDRYMYVLKKITAAAVIRNLFRTKRVCDTR